MLLENILLALALAEEAGFGVQTHVKAVQGCDLQGIVVLGLGDDICPSLGNSLISHLLINITSLLHRLIQRRLLLKVRATPTITPARPDLLISPAS